MASKFRKPSADVFRQKVKRRAEDRKVKGNGGGRYRNLPEGTEFFRPKKGTMRLNFIPYVISIDNHPEGLEKNDIWYMKTIFVHYGVGVEEKSYICPKTIGKPCPICDYGKKLAKDPDADEEQVKALRAKERNLFNVIDLDDEEKGIQLWEFSYHLFYKQLEEELNESDNPEYAGFSLPEDGYTLKIRFSEEQLSSNTFLTTSRIDFSPRKKNYTDELIEKAPDLDAIVNVLDYDTLNNIFLDLTPDKQSSSDEGIDSGSDEYDEPETDRRSSRKEKDAEVEEEKPKNTRKSSIKEEEDPEPVEIKKGSSDERCPHGGIFGKSTDSIDGCEKCEIWDECIDAKESN